MPEKTLSEIIEHLHGVKATWIESVPVREVFNKLVAWEGEVEVFALDGHPKAKKCYAWQYRDKDETKTVTVLEIPPVDSPQTAVQVAIANEARKNK